MPTAISCTLWWAMVTLLSCAAVTIKNLRNDKTMFQLVRFLIGFTIFFIGMALFLEGMEKLREEPGATLEIDILKNFVGK
jgi:hypothetical protein